MTVLGHQQTQILITMIIIFQSKFLTTLVIPFNISQIFQIILLWHLVGNHDTSKDKNRLISLNMKIHQLATNMPHSNRSEILKDKYGRFPWYYNKFLQVSVLIQKFSVPKTSKLTEGHRFVSRKFCCLFYSWRVTSSITLGMGSANENRCYIVTSPAIGWAHTQTNP